MSDFDLTEFLRGAAKGYRLVIELSALAAVLFTAGYVVYLMMFG